MNNRYAIVTLVELLTVTSNGAMGFTACAQQARSASLKRELFVRAGRLAAAAAQLGELLSQLGADAHALTHSRAASERGWANLPAVLSQNNDAALVLQCEHGQDHTLEVYRNALDEHLPEVVQLVVFRQFEELVSDHDQFRILRGEPLVGSAAAPSTGGSLRQ